MGGWFERIHPVAVEGADFSEWCVKKNHDANLLLAASWSGTATHTIDEKGVLTRALVGDSTIWNDTIKEVERGDLACASFEFQNASDGVEWTRELNEAGTEIEVRNIKRFYKIWDQSPVVVPAYPDTKGITVAKREYDQILNQRAVDENKPEPPPIIETPAPTDKAWEVEIELLELESAV